MSISAVRTKERQASLFPLFFKAFGDIAHHQQYPGSRTNLHPTVCEHHLPNRERNQHANGKEAVASSAEDDDLFGIALGGRSPKRNCDCAGCSQSLDVNAPGHSDSLDPTQAAKAFGIPTRRPEAVQLTETRTHKAPQTKTHLRIPTASLRAGPHLSVHRRAGREGVLSKGSVMPSALSHLECPKCSARFDADAVHQLCLCGAPLLVRYDCAAAAATFTRERLARGEPSMWRYADMLPLRNPDERVSLHEAMTPVHKLSRIGSSLGFDALFLKDEGTLPTGSFKARGAAVGISRARELGVRSFAMPTNGNAGAAWAAYAARAGMAAYLVMPESAPGINRLECVMYGARVFLVDGLISDAGAIVARSIAEGNLYDASTLKEPYRIEGKKTIGFELADQFAWEVPDVILYPTGGGVGLIGIYKALRELQQLGIIAERMPRLVAVQAQGCAPIVKAWSERKAESEFWPSAHTAAFGITVPKALGDFLVLEALYATSGCAVSVSDEALLTMQERIGKSEGLFVCPEGAATLAAAERLRAEGWIERAERVLLINTGTGLKYPDIPCSSSDLLGKHSTLPKE